MTSLLFYVALVAALAGFAATALPVFGSRARGLLLAAAGLAAGTVCLMWPAPRASQSKGTRLIDQAMPRYTFREIHRTRICAPAERVYEAMKNVRTDEIGWFGLLTSLRGMGVGEDASQPVLETATHHGFIVLADVSPAEMVLGTGGPFWRITRLPREESVSLLALLRATAGDPRAFATTALNGYPKAAFNFALDAATPGCQVLTTETRIGAGDPDMMEIFARYWRVVWPGSALLRRTWLDAIRRRAEAPPARALRPRQEMNDAVEPDFRKPAAP